MDGNGILRWQVGRVRVTRVVESCVPIDLTALVPEATREALERHRDWLSPHFLDPDGRVPLSIHSLVIESEGRRILLDTCLGDFELPLPGFDAVAGDPHFAPPCAGHIVRSGVGAIFSTKG
jgi:hypothetical protein